MVSFVWLSIRAVVFSDCRTVVSALSRWVFVLAVARNRQLPLSKFRLGMFFVGVA